MSTRFIHEIHAYELLERVGLALDRWGVADPTAAALLVWAMLAGLASGTGWRPGRTLPRRLLCSESCLVALTLSLLRIAGH